MHVGVKLLYEHGGTPQGYLTKRFPSLSVIDIEKRSIGKVRQNHMALWMNAMFRKVLREILMGFLIMEPNVKRGNGRIKRRWWPEKKRVSDRSRFAPGCYMQSIRERETANTIITQNKKIEKKGYVCMKYAWTCDTLKENCIMGSTQSKPSNTRFSTNKHTSKCMKHCGNANGMQCMII